jgi:hypothetical protein
MFIFALSLASEIAEVKTCSIFILFKMVKEIVELEDVSLPF